MSFTALHRLLGVEPAPLTDEMIDLAIEQGISETDDLDWKSALPPAKGLSQTDYPKDIAAMANSGGGMIVYGVAEDQKAATGRTDVGDLDEGHERALRSAAVTAISPPIFGLHVHRLGAPGSRVVAVVVPGSVDGPHLIYRGELFGAPVRNDADTVWMRERQIEAMYRARFDERRHATEALDHLYAEAVRGRDIESRAWFIAVGHPRLPATPAGRPTREEAKDTFETAGRRALSYAGRHGIHPLETVDRLNPRPGLRRWVAPNTATTDTARWKEAWASVHHDGSVSIAAAIGAHRSGADTFLAGSQVRSAAIECAVADLMGLIRAVGRRQALTEYEVVVGVEWSGAEPLLIQTVDQHGFAFDGNSIPLPLYTRVATTVRADVDDGQFLDQVHDLALDCVNQGGISTLQLIRITDDEQ
ncbi:ATP-binding protein [Iamia majanohamensis]|uniref:ATP-binding protein n=1 Tax=Iamia majanohamensis TaxID=467976 RepID=A0AAE9Y7E5_9ACTN|nr:ATP-binding protein [Iamia majanohamensis]WCO67932.1 ATP-binding protein [Iamia majanohamensis]